MNPHRLLPLSLSFLSLCAFFTGVCAADPPASAASPSPVLQLRLVAEAPGADTEKLAVLPKDTSADKQSLDVHKTVLRDESSVESAFVFTEQDGRTCIAINLTEDGAKKFADITRQHKGRNLAIVVGGELQS